MQDKSLNIVINSITRRLDEQPGLQLLEELDAAILGKTLDNETRGEIAALRGDIFISIDRPIAAEENYRLAIQCFPNGSYSKYAVQITLAKLLDDSSLYLDAIRTALDHGALHCSSALVGLISLAPSKSLDLEAQDVLNRGINMSWKALRLPGVPPVSVDQACYELYEMEFDQRPS